MTTAVKCTNSAVLPALRPDYSSDQLAAWLGRHEEFVAIAHRGGCEILFLGDSITDGWRTHGRESWDEFFAPLKAANFGLSGDRTQQLLWRLQHGELAGPMPKVVVLLIGTNNLDPGLGESSLTPRNTASEIAAGITAVVDSVRGLLPETRVLLLGILPRGPRDAPVRREIAAINTAIRLLDDEGRRIAFFDAGPLFLASDGSIRADFMPDQLHLSAAGYRILATALAAPLRNMLRPLR